MDISFGCVFDSGECSALLQQTGGHCLRSGLLRSIGPANFVKQLNFVQKLVQKFDIGPGPTQTRIGLLTFGRHVWRKFNLKDKMDETELLKSIKTMKLDRGNTTETANAIEFARRNMFKAAAGSRQNMAHIAVVITDGRSQKTRRTSKAAKRAQKAGILMFAIGVGKGVDHQELSDIASDPEDQFKFIVDDFNALSSITEMLAERPCPVTQPPTLTPTTELLTTTTMTPAENCIGIPADVYFLIDSSGSITTSKFYRVLQFVKNVVSIFDIAPNETRVGVISFSDNADHFLNLTNDLNKSELIKMIEKVRHVGENTNTADALRMMRQDGFATEVARPNISQIAIVLTGGRSSDQKLTANESRIAHELGRKVSAISIGDGVDMVEIRNIASDPHDDYVLQVADIASLDSIKEALTIKTCGPKPVKQPVCLVKTNTALIFTYDSAALGEAKSHIISEFIAEIVSNLDMRGRYLRVGRSTENCPSGANLDPSNRLTGADFAELHFSSFGHLLNSIHRTIFSRGKGSSSVTVMFVDSGMQGLDRQAIHAAKTLSQYSVLYVIAIGHGPNIDSFSTCIHNVTGRNFIQIHSYDALAGLQQAVLNELCNFFDTPLIQSTDRLVLV